MVKTQMVNNMTYVVLSVVILGAVFLFGIVKREKPIPNFSLATYILGMITLFIVAFGAYANAPAYQVFILLVAAYLFVSVPKIKVVGLELKQIISSFQKGSQSR